MKIKEREKEETASPPPTPTEKVLYDNRIKRKNVLALNEKVAALREYEKVPVYKRIGRMFHCSPDQIKRIVQHKDAILKAWEQRTRRCQDAKTLEMKVVRVSMLGKAVYDWMRRMMYYQDIKITDGLIQKVALQFKSAMGLQNFFPHQEWCDKFRQTYKINQQDSKLLKIGYTQGYSVQIKDVMKDVLSECTPDAATSDSEDDDKDENANECESVNSNDVGKKTTAKSKPKTASLTNNNNNNSGNTEQSTSKTMPQLQPIRQLVSLPLQGNRAGMPQKVLVATPIAPAGQVPGTSPMTMTIIPLTTIANPQNVQQPAANDKQTVPPPMVEIKQEIKQEPEDEPIHIKQEYISDDEGDMQDVVEAARTSVEKNTRTDTRNVIAAKKTTTEAISQMIIEADLNAEMDEETDDDNLALSRLRKLIQNESSVVSTAQSNSTASQVKSGTPNAPYEKTATTAANVMTSIPIQFRSSTFTPPLPPLTKAPAAVLSRLANKRKHNADEIQLPAIKSCAEARKYLKLVEDFALVRENFRLIGLITRADEVLREMDGDEDVDVD